MDDAPEPRADTPGPRTGAAPEPSAFAAAPPSSPSSSRSLANLEGFLRGIRVPQADLDAMTAIAHAETTQLLAEADPVAEVLAVLGWLAFPGRAQGVYRDAADRLIQRRQENGPPDLVDFVDRGLVSFWNDEPSHLDAIVDGIERLYAPLPARPELDGIRDGRVVLDGIRDGRVEIATEMLVNHREGRYASAVALAITQIDGIAADVPPTPGAAFPFLVGDKRDRDRPDPTLTPEILAAHPGCTDLVFRMMRTSRPDTNVGAGVHRHGIMHGRDLRFGTYAQSTKVLSILLALITWAAPVARARAGDVL